MQISNLFSIICISRSVYPLTNSRIKVWDHFFVENQTNFYKVCGCQMFLEKNTFLKVKDWAELNFSMGNSIFSTKTHFWSLLYSAQNLALKWNQICETKVLNGLYELIEEK